MAAEDRIRLLTSLLQGDVEPDEIAAGLARLGWDSDRALVTLRREHASSILERYLEGRVAPEWVFDWANAIENRDDVGFDAHGPQLLQDLVFEMANPSLTTPLTPSRARWWLERLRV